MTRKETECRKAFEEWRADSLRRCITDSFNYEDSHTQLAWSAWRAAWDWQQEFYEQ